MRPNVRVCSATPWEVAQVSSLIGRQSGGVYLEIGSFQGGSLAAYGGSMPSGSLLIGVDRPQTEAARKSLYGVAGAMIEAGYPCEVIEGDSHEAATLDRVRECLGGRSVDAMLIDGDHSPEGCRRDLDAFSPLVRAGGLILMHDCGGPEPARPMNPVVAAVIAGLHEVWRARSCGRRRVMVQEWCGYGGWWQ